MDHHHDNISASKDESKSGTQEMDDRANDVSQGSAKDYHDHTSIKKQKLDSESEQEMENDSSSRIVSDVDRKKCIRLKDYRAQGKKPFNAISESKSGTQEMDDRANDVSQGSAKDYHDHTSIKKQKLDSESEQEMENDSSSRIVSDVDRKKCIRLKDYRAQGKKPFNAISEVTVLREDSESQSHLKTIRPGISFATVNARTMSKIGKTEQMAALMRKNNWDILAISETRWPGSGLIKLDLGELVLYSGHEDKFTHSQGVALMLSKQAQRSIIEWKLHGSRIILASFRTVKKNLYFVQCYAPTNKNKETDDFYNRLTTILRGIPKNDYLILMGDFNAKVGSDNSGYEEVMGKHGIGEMNENGKRFADLCATFNLVIGGTVFSHKRIHKATWISPGQSTENQIDHICIRKKCRRFLQDVCVNPGADVASDHHPLCAKLKLTLKQTSGPSPLYNLLKGSKKQEEDKVALTKIWQLLKELGKVKTEQDWLKGKETVTSICLKILDPNICLPKEWIGEGTKQKIEERNEKLAKVNRSKTLEAKREAQKEYTEIDKTINHSMRTDKQNYIDTVEAALQNCIKDRVPKQCSHLRASN
ncbi:craniofacial development protein 2-like isoform X2 [Biomphalaria glabrata]|uniref:Craniofacial development protein 2-like isoform X2 n=1 Tax=Biomphalaria glabrata TaxID=6526 RepID=A0A9W3AWA9_BIOGL|nr:craniofacial development protein 2-like isoform X2 [Biomphalaria glabrata]